MDGWVSWNSDHGDSIVGQLLFGYIALVEQGTVM